MFEDRCSRHTAREHSYVFSDKRLGRPILPDVCVSHARDVQVSIKGTGAAALNGIKLHILWAALISCGDFYLTTRALEVVREPTM